MNEEKLKRALIFGASRGLGLALCSEYLRNGWEVTATVRGSTRSGLHELAERANGRLTIENADINEPGQLAALAQRLKSARFDLLFVNAGVANDPAQTVGDTPTEEFIRVMTTNALSPMRVVEQFADLVGSDGTIGVMSSGLGSVANNQTGGWEVYRASKAALNTLMRSYAARRGGRGPGLVLIAPGWVRTDMGGPSAALDVSESIPGVVASIASCAGRPGLRYLDYQGKTVPW